MPDKATVDAWLNAASKPVTPPAASAPESAPVAAVEATDASDTSSVDDVSADPDAPGQDGTSDATDDSSNPTADSDSDTPAGAQGDGKPRQRSAAQERIEELVFERNAAQKFNDHLLETIKELKAGKTVPAPADAPATTTPVASDGDEPPTIDQFNFDPIAFSKAQTKWMKDQVAKSVQAALAEAKGKQVAQDNHAEFIKREAAARAEFADFDVVTSKNPNFPKLSQKAASLIVASELGPKIAYELGKNAALGARIERMDADAQIAAIGRIEGTLEARAAAAPVAKPKTQQKTVTKAPPPPTPVRGSSNPQKQISEMSMQEFVAHERAQKIAKREESLKLRRAMR